MRAMLTVIHRWFGLFIAVFLFIAGITGAIIAWTHELDALVAPEFFYAEGDGVPMSALDAVRQVEAEHPEFRITYAPTAIPEGETLIAYVMPRSIADGSKPELGFNQIAINPYNGEVQAKRQWGELSLSRANLLPFIYKLHYSLHMPELGGWDTGVWLMGIIGVVWILDCFIALGISFPSRAKWRKSFAFRWRSNSHKITFDLHRSGGVWIWAFLLVLAVTSVSMNLGSQVVKPVVNFLSPLTPGPFETVPKVATAAPYVSRETIVAAAEVEAQRQGISKPLGGLYYSVEKDLYEIWFFEPGHPYGGFGLGNPRLYFGGAKGNYVGSVIPGEGTAGDIFVQLQFPLHSGRILGIPGRVLVTIMGLLIAILSVTGVIIWARKRRARIVAAIPAGTAYG